MNISTSSHSLIRIYTKTMREKELKSKKYKLGKFTQDMIYQR